jgi:hypothetical protein
MRGIIQYQISWFNNPPVLPSPIYGKDEIGCRGQLNINRHEAHSMVRQISDLNVVIEHPLYPNVQRLKAVVNKMLLPMNDADVSNCNRSLASHDPIHLQEIELKRLEVLKKRAQQQIVASKPVPLDADILSYDYQDTQPHTKVSIRINITNLLVIN